MITVASFQTPEDAHLFRAYLGSRGIEAFLIDEFFVQLFWHYSNAIGGVRVAVQEEDANDAIESYGVYMDSLRSGPYPLNPVRAWPAVIIISLCFGAPFLLFGRRPNSTRNP